MRFTLVASAAALALVAACAPKPEPIMPEPVYTGKYGDVVVGTCRAPGQAVTAQYPSSLPLCDESCAPGTSYAGTNAAGAPICVPTSTDGREPDRGQTTGR